MSRIVNLLLAGLIGLVAAMILVTMGRSPEQAESPTERAAAAQRQPSPDASGGTASHAGTQQYAVLIRKPTGPPQIELAGADPQGRSASVACSTCHSVREPDFNNVSAASLDEFHQGMTFNHGTLGCYACHNPQDADSLRLADGTPVPYEEVMTLCSQCHGSQATAFAHGAHGGMTGFWDLSRGPQMKNNCIDCHDPHAPSFPNMIVGFKPKDRFNEPADHGHAGAESHGNE